MSRKIDIHDKWGQGGQFGHLSPQVAGRKRAAGWDSGRGGAVQNLPNSQVSNNRSKKGKGPQVPMTR